MGRIGFALALAGAIAFALPATAQHRHQGGGWSPPVYHHNGGGGGHPAFNGGGGHHWNPGPAIGLGIIGGALLGAGIAGAMECSSLEDHLAQIGPPMPGFCWQPTGGNLCGNVSWQQVPC